VKKPDEIALWDAFGDGAPHQWPRDAGIALGIPSGRVEYLCEKWSRQGVYDYGVAASLGWKEPVVHAADHTVGSE
jgi:hypothetical protein